MNWTRISSTAAAVGITAALASAQWSDGLEAYARETIAARILSGDQSAGNVTPEQVEYVRRHLGSALPHPGADRRSNSR